MPSQPATATTVRARRTLIARAGGRRGGSRAHDRRSSLACQDLTPPRRDGRVAAMRARLTAALLLLLVAPAVARAETPVEQARALVPRHPEDRAGLDRARELLEDALPPDSQVEPMILL